MIRSCSYSLDISPSHPISPHILLAVAGTTQLERLYAEAKQSVDRTVADLDFMLQMLREVQAPGL